MLFYRGAKHYEIHEDAYIRLNRVCRLVVRSSFVFANNNCYWLKINHVIYFSQSQLLLAKTNEDLFLQKQTTFVFANNNCDWLKQLM